MSNTSSVTTAVVNIIDGARIDQFPEESLVIGKRCIIDGLGVMLAGSTQPAGEIIRDFVKDLGANAQSTAYS